MVAQNYRKKVVFILNIRLNQEYRINRMLTLLTKIVDYPDAFFSIRVRGNLKLSAYAEIYQLFASKQFINYKLYIGDDFKQWKVNTLKQVIDSQGYHFVLLQEDHFLISETKDLANYVNYLISKNVDLGHITSWYTYLEVRNQIVKFENFIHNDFGITYDLSQSPWRYLGVNKPRYIVPLVAYFRKDFLIKILCSSRPFWRRYPALSPFDFEQSPNADWFLPALIGFPNKEIFACIDDDIEAIGSSLQSRGLYKLDQIRTNEQHNTERISIQRNIPWIRKKILVGKYENGVYIALKSDFYKHIWMKVSKTIINTIRFFDSCVYTLHAFLNYVLNIPEFMYKGKVKKTIWYD